MSCFARPVRSDPGRLHNSFTVIRLAFLDITPGVSRHCQSDSQVNSQFIRYFCYY